MPPCKKKWLDKKTTLTVTPEGRRPQTFFPPVITLPIPAPLSSSPVYSHCRAAALPCPQFFTTFQSADATKMSFSLFINLIISLQ